MHNVIGLTATSKSAEKLSKPKVTIYEKMIKFMNKQVAPDDAEVIRDLNLFFILVGLSHNNLEGKNTSNHILPFLDISFKILALKIHLLQEFQSRMPFTINTSNLFACNFCGDLFLETFADDMMGNSAFNTIFENNGKLLGMKGYMFFALGVKSAGNKHGIGVFGRDSLTTNDKHLGLIGWSTFRMIDCFANFIYNSATNQNRIGNKIKTNYLIDINFYVLIYKFLLFGMHDYAYGSKESYGLLTDEEGEKKTFFQSLVLLLNIVHLVNFIMKRQFLSSKLRIFAGINGAFDITFVMRIGSFRVCFVFSKTGQLKELRFALICVFNVAEQLRQDSLILN